MTPTACAMRSLLDQSALHNEGAMPLLLDGLLPMYGSAARPAMLELLKAGIADLLFREPDSQTDGVEWLRFAEEATSILLLNFDPDPSEVGLAPKSWPHATAAEDVPFVARLMVFGDLGEYLGFDDAVRQLYRDDPRYFVTSGGLGYHGDGTNLAPEDRASLQEWREIVTKSGAIVVLVRARHLTQLPPKHQRIWRDHYLPDARPYPSRRP